MARHGIPKVVVSENGSQYMSAEFSKFAGEWEFVQVTSSPFHPEGNGQADRGVQIVKDIVKKAQECGEDPYLCICLHSATHPLRRALDHLLCYSWVEG